MFLFKVVYLYTRNLSHGMASEETSAGWIYTTGEEAGCPANMEEIWPHTNMNSVEISIGKNTDLKRERE